MPLSISVQNATHTVFHDGGRYHGKLVSLVTTMYVFCWAQLSAIQCIPRSRATVSEQAHKHECGELPMQIVDNVSYS